MEQTDGRDETNRINNDSEEEAPSSNSSNGVTQRASSPRKRALRLYSSDQSDVVKSTTPTPQDEEQTSTPSCPVTRSKALSSGAVQNMSSSSSSASPEDSSGDSSEGGAREKTTPLVKTRPTRKGRFAKGTTLMASLKVKQNGGGGTSTCKTKKGASSNRRSSKGKEEASPVSDNTAASDKNVTTGTTENEDHMFGGVLSSIPDVGLCSFSVEVANVNSSKRKKRSLSPPLDSDPHKTNKASKMSDEDSDRVLSPEIDLQNQTTATSSIQPPAIQAVKQDGVMASSQSCYTTAGQYNALSTQELINNIPPINTAMPIGVARVPHHSSRSLVGIHWSNEGGTRHPLMATGPSVLSVPEEVQNVSVIDTSAFPFHTLGRIGRSSGESLPLTHRSNWNTASSSQYTIHHRVNTDHVTGGHVTSGIGHVTGGIGHVTSGIGHVTGGVGHVTSVAGHVTGGVGHVTSVAGHVTGGVSHVTSGIGHVTSGVSHVTSGVSHVTSVAGHVTSGIGHVTSVAGRLSDMSLMQGYFLYPHHQFNEYLLSHGPVLTNAVSSPITSSIINEPVSTSSLSNTSSTTNKGINPVHTGINFAMDSAQVKINPAYTGINSLHSSSGSSKMDNNNNIRLLSPDTLSMVSLPQGVTSSYSSSFSHLLTSSPLITSTAGASTTKTTPTSSHSSPLVSNLLMTLPSHFQSIGLASTVSEPSPLSPPPPFSSPFLPPSSLYSIVGMNLNTAPTVSAGSKKSSTARRSSVPLLAPSKKNNKSSQTKTTSATTAKKVSHSSTSGSKSSRTSSTSSSKVFKKTSHEKNSSQASTPPYLQVSPEWKDSLQSKMRDLLRINSKSSESRSGLTTPSALTVTPITPSNSTNNFPFPVPISPRPSSLAPAPSLLAPLSPSSLPLSPSSLPFSPPRTRPSKKTTKQSKGCTNKLTRPPPMRATTPSILGRTGGSPPFNAGAYQPPNSLPLTAAIASCLISPDQIDILGLNNFSSSLLSLLTGSAGFACLDAINYAELERQFRSAQSILETQQLHVNNLKNRLVQARFQQQVLLLQSDHYQGCTKNLILPSMRDHLEVPISIPGYKTNLSGSIPPDQWKGSFERPHLECLDFYK